MAHTKAQKAVSGNRDSQSKRLGVKRFGGELVKPGYIIVRQRGTRYHPADGVILGKDFTIMAAREGRVKFFQRFGKKCISVVK
jgi:large subunit ribosomal protein L27